MKWKHTPGPLIRDEFRTTASPEQAWCAWTDPAKLAQWFVDRAEGEAVEGGTVTWFFDRFGISIPYRVLEVTPHERYVISASVPGRGEGILEIAIRREAGSTLVTLVNSGWLDGEGWEDEYQGVVSGWRCSMALLKLYLENYYAQPRSVFWTMLPAAFSYESLLPQYLYPTPWLGVSPGGMLVNTGREVVYEWPEIGGVIELKAFAMGKGARALAIRGCGWQLDPARAQSIESEMTAALSRLAARIE